MALQFDQLLDSSKQSALAEEIVSAIVAVVSNASAPDFAVQTLEKGLSSDLSIEQRDAAVALQVHAVKCAKGVLTSALDATAAERAETLRLSLEKNCSDSALSTLEEVPQAAADFKAAMCLSIVGKCADLTAAEMDRLKKGKITILNEEDQRVFDQQHEQHQEKQMQAITAFLSSLPQRYPSFGRSLFNNIRQHVQHDIEERYKSPDIHDKVDSLFRDALSTMPPDAHDHPARPV
ncbi:hypothetical protein Q8A64_18525 [Oxalobacteraceae bacterium R-40]|uniref:Uncharacterized protein n=1 Tax=Keguizhuia sedimenti TaxID=3064264 RepID=A0ABU1BWM3_9BURK|nr:hypothetical protein [Oxalobacteraceae bacterium R-40]